MTGTQSASTATTTGTANASGGGASEPPSASGGSGSSGTGSGGFFDLLGAIPVIPALALGVPAVTFAGVLFLLGDTEAYPVEIATTPSPAIAGERVDYQITTEAPEGTLDSITVGSPIGRVDGSSLPEGAVVTVQTVGGDGSPAVSGVEFGGESITAEFDDPGVDTGTELVVSLPGLEAPEPGEHEVPVGVNTGELSGDEPIGFVFVADPDDA